MTHPDMTRFWLLLTAIGSFSASLPVTVVWAQQPAAASQQELLRFVQSHCIDCHSGDAAEGGLDLDALGLDLDQKKTFDRWVLIHDRVRAGEMPPPDTGIAVPIAVDQADDQGLRGDQDPVWRSDARQWLDQLASALVRVDRQRIDATGRAKVRRLNRLEYENALRELLSAPWLQVADSLPEDAVDHLFNKIGERLDVSHVQMTRYLETARDAVHRAVQAAAHPTETRKSYAREEPMMQNYLRYRFGQTAALRSIMPLVDLEPEPDVIRGTQPMTVGADDPDKREREAMGVFSGTYSATTKYDFTQVAATADGEYRLRFKTYTFRAGPGGADAGDDHGLTGGKREWWRPDRTVALAGNRSEPVTLYALAPSGDSRWLTTFDSQPDPTVFECVVALKKGEGIRPDAARLVRTRPGWAGNPVATREGIPGFAMNWLEIEGPLHDTWPPESYRAIFADLPFEVTAGGDVKALSENPQADAERLLLSIYRRAVVDDSISPTSVAPFVDLYGQAKALGYDFTESLVYAVAAMLCSPDFLYLDAQPGPLSDRDVHQRLAYFLWNGPSLAEPTSGEVSAEEESKITPEDRARRIRATVENMLDDSRSDRFVRAFLDYWLDLRDINANTPDAELYPDYYLDELLTESSLLETQAFFRELIDHDLPVRHLVDSDFVFVNERLADHYGIPGVEGVGLRRVAVPEGSPRGGLLTQASVLRVTANGTTTSPVIRGAWIAERILGLEIPPPPSGVAAVEPDIRGAKTIREQLDKHRAIDSCNACHRQFDPAGFALESFDVAGGYRDRYRAVGDQGDPVEGIGKNGHAFKFRFAQSVDCRGVLANGREFEDIVELKRILVSDPRQLARNLLQRLMVYATGAPITFADRDEIEAMLDQASDRDYGVRTLIHAVAQSQLFLHK